MMMNNLMQVEGLKTPICDVILNMEDLQYNRGKKREGVFLLVADDGHFISFIGCNSVEELGSWSIYFNTFDITEEKKTLIECSILDQYDLPYEVNKDKKVWVLISSLSFDKYDTMEEAVITIEHCLIEEEATIDDISVLVGKEIPYKEEE